MRGCAYEDHGIDLLTLGWCQYCLQEAASFDEVEAAGLDGTLRDGRDPYTKEEIAR